ncbi:MAG: peptidoglycan editing factor PgeF [Sphingomonadales bacterium]
MTLRPFTSTLLESPGISHGFFTRNGGVSSGIYQSLNCGPGSADDPISVQQNRNQVAVHLTGSEGHINTLYQVHSSTLVVLDKAMPKGERVKADAMITKQKGLILGVLTADCAPILFADPVVGIIAAAHAGWRGALDEIIENVVANMTHLGSSLKDIRAVIGPAIGPDSYEVGKEFRDTFIQRRNENKKYFSNKSNGKFLFDLERFCLDHLAEAGLTKIAGFSLDTYAKPQEFFSYRRTTHLAEKDYGRQISAITLI